MTPITSLSACPTCGTHIEAHKFIMGRASDKSYIVLYKDNMVVLNKQMSVVFSSLAKHSPNFVNFELLITALWEPKNEPENPTKQIQRLASMIRARFRSTKMPLAIDNSYEFGYRLRVLKL